MNLTEVRSGAGHQVKAKSKALHSVKRSLEDAYTELSLLNGEEVKIMRANLNSNIHVCNDLICSIEDSINQND